MINENVQIIDENESEFVEIMPTGDRQTEFGVTLFKAFLKTLGTRKSEAAILRSAQVLDETFVKRRSSRLNNSILTQALRIRICATGRATGCLLLRFKMMAQR